jgi:hypothetical protein
MPSMPSARGFRRTARFARRILRRKYFSKPTLASVHPFALDDQLTLRGGICGCATKAMPPSPKSARQTAFQVPDLIDSAPCRADVADVVRRRRHHRFDHEAGLRHAAGHRRRPHRRDGDADADREDIGEFRVLLVLVDDGEAARIAQPLDAAHRRDAAEGGQHHRKAKGISCVGLDLPSSATSSTVILPASTFFTRDEVIHLMCLLAQGAFEQALGVAHAVEAEMADIGLGGDEGHRHLVAHLGGGAARFRE